MKKTTLIIMFITIFSKVSGFAREIVLSYKYGASAISDAYLISITVPMVIFGFVSAGISAGYIPIYSKLEELDGVEVANDFTSKLIKLLMNGCVVVVIIGSFFSKQVVFLFASGFDESTFYLANYLTKRTLYSLFFIILVTLFSSYLQIKNRYSIVAFIGIPMNLVIILSILMSNIEKMEFLAYGYIFAVIIQLLVLLPFIRISGFSLNIKTKVLDENVMEMIISIIPVILGVSVNQLNILIDRTIASRIVEGGISALNYSYRLNGFIQGVIVYSIAAVLYPSISKLAVSRDYHKIGVEIGDSILNIIWIIVPATFGAMIFSREIIMVLFGRGAFGLEAINLTSSTLFYYSIGMIGFGLREILYRGFYSIQDTKTPMRNAILGVMINIILNIVLSYFMGISGLALATSISAIFTSLMLFKMLTRKLGPIRVSVEEIRKIFMSSAIMGIIVKFVYEMSVYKLNLSLSLFVSVSLGVVSYLILMVMLKSSRATKITKRV